MKSFKKYKSFLVYVIFGFLASVINVYVFNFYHINLGSTIIVSNTVAWFISNLFSFFCNKHIVFNNGKHGYKDYLRELSTFFSTRIFSWIADMFIMYIGVWFIPTHPVVVKIIDQVLIGIFNYLMTKIIFVHDNRSLINRMKEKRHQRKA